MKINKYSLITSIIILLIVFQDVLTDSYFHFMTYLDEIVTLILFGLAIIGLIKKHRTSKFNRKFLIVLSVYYFVGWGCYFLHTYQPIGIAFSSSLLSIKFFLLLIGQKKCCESFKGIKYYLALMYKVEFPLLVFVLIFVLISILFNTTMFFWPWDLCAKSIFFMGITISNWKNSRKDILSIILCIILLLSTGKAKAFAAIALTIVVGYWILKKSKKIKWYHLLSVGALSIAVTWNKIYYYYINGYGRYARSVLTLTGLKIAKDYFPLGLGWASYGSYYAYANYSPVYFNYGLSTHGELGVNSRAFMMDTYWPSVLGETGWLGLALILILVIFIFVNNQRKYRIDTKCYAAGILIVLYLIVTTFEESGFMQPDLMCLALLLGLIIADTDNISKKIQEKK